MAVVWIALIVAVAIVMYGLMRLIDLMVRG